MEPQIEPAIWFWRLKLLLFVTSCSPKPLARSVWIHENILKRNLFFPPWILKKMIFHINGSPFWLCRGLPPPNPRPNKLGNLRFLIFNIFFDVENSTFWQESGSETMLNRRGLKNHAECTSQSVKRTSGARVMTCLRLSVQPTIHPIESPSDRQSVQTYWDAKQILCRLLRHLLYS